MRTRSPHAEPPAAPSPSASLEQARASEVLEREPHRAHRSARAPAAAARSSSLQPPAARRRRGRWHSPKVLRNAPSASDRPTPMAASALLGSPLARCGRPRLRPPRSPRSSSSAQSVVAPQAGDQREAVARQARDVARMRSGPRAARHRSRASKRRGSRQSSRRSALSPTRRASAAAMPGGLRDALGARSQAALLTTAVQHGRERRDAAAREHCRRPCGPCSLWPETAAVSARRAARRDAAEATLRPARRPGAAAPRARRTARRSRARAGSRR